MNSPLQIQKKSKITKQTSCFAISDKKKANKKVPNTCMHHPNIHKSTEYLNWILHHTGSSVWSVHVPYAHAVHCTVFSHHPHIEKKNILRKLTKMSKGKGKSKYITLYDNEFYFCILVRCKKKFTFTRLCSIVFSGLVIKKMCLVSLAKLWHLIAKPW